MFTTVKGMHVSVSSRHTKVLGYHSLGLELQGLLCTHTCNKVTPEVESHKFVLPAILSMETPPAPNPASERGSARERGKRCYVYSCLARTHVAGMYVPLLCSQTALFGNVSILPTLKE